MIYLFRSAIKAHYTHWSADGPALKIACGLWAMSVAIFVLATGPAINHDVSLYLAMFLIAAYFFVGGCATWLVDAMIALIVFLVIWVRGIRNYAKVVRKYNLQPGWEKEL